MTFRALTFNAMQSSCYVLQKPKSGLYTTAFRWNNQLAASKTVLFSKVPSQALKDVICDSYEGLLLNLNFDCTFLYQSYRPQKQPNRHRSRQSRAIVFLLFLKILLSFINCVM